MADYRVAPGQAQEDQFTASIEQYTSQLPSSAYLGLAFASILGSVSFQLAGKKHEGAICRPVGRALSSARDL